MAIMFLPATIFAWPVPDTGQTKCYDDVGLVEHIIYWKRGGKNSHLWNCDYSA